MLAGIGVLGLIDGMWRGVASTSPRSENRDSEIQDDSAGSLPHEHDAKAENVDAAGGHAPEAAGGTAVARLGEARAAAKHV
jgi:hypothetical protein